jgi:hypothetical protein
MLARVGSLLQVTSIEGFIFSASKVLQQRIFYDASPQVNPKN